jgi:hypothetical protein
MGHARERLHNVSKIRGQRDINVSSDGWDMARIYASQACNMLIRKDFLFGLQMDTTSLWIRGLCAWICGSASSVRVQYPLDGQSSRPGIFCGSYS